MIMNTESMKIRIGGDNDIDLETLTNTLSSTIEALKLISDDVLDDKDYCKFVVKNVERGSFVLDIQTVSAIGTICSTILGPTKTALETFKAYWDIKTILKGNKPKSIEKNGDYVTINAYDNTQVTVTNNVYNYYIGNQKMENSLSGIVKAVERDEARTSISYDFDNGESVFIPRDQFKQLSTPMDVRLIEDEVQSKSTISRTIVNVIKPDLQNSTKWELVYSGDSIKADIADCDFLEAVHAKFVEFTSMQEMDVDIEVTFLVDKNGVPKSNSKRSFTIKTVYSCGKYKQGDFKQPTLFDD